MLESFTWSSRICGVIFSNPIIYLLSFSSTVTIGIAQINPLVEYTRVDFSLNARVV